jgi:tetratricopeptide (TPR) repeat protein
MSDEIDKKVEEIAKAPDWVRKWLSPLLGLGFLLADMAELPKHLGVPEPASDVIAAAIGGFFIWMWLVYLARKLRRAVPLLVLALLLGCGYAISHLWLAYTGNALPWPVFFLTATLFSAVALLTFLAEDNRLTALARLLRRRLPANVIEFFSTSEPHEIIALCCGAVVAGSVFFVSLVRHEDWYLVADTLLAKHIEPGHVGVLIAPYNYDSEKGPNEQQRFVTQLHDLLEKDDVLNRTIVPELLDRPIPGYVESGPIRFDEESEQEATGRHIAAYLGGDLVIYGAVMGADYKKFIRTRIVVAGTCDPDDPLLPAGEIHVDAPKSDAAHVHFLSAVVIALVDMNEARFKDAEASFDDALKDVPHLQERGDQDVRLDEKSVAALRLLKATSIVHQISQGVAPRTRADEALTLAKGVTKDPAADAFLHVMAGETTGLLWRNLSQFDRDAAKRNADLDAARIAYLELLHTLPSDAEPISFAATWNNLGVVYEKLAGPQPPLKLEPLQNAENSYQTAADWLKKEKNTTSPWARCLGAKDTAALLAAIENNLGVVLDKKGYTMKSAAEIKRAIAAFSSARPSPGDSLIPTLEMNLANAHRHLAAYENRSTNLAQARDHATEALALLTTGEHPADRAEALFALGQIDVTLGGLADNSDTKRAVQEWACAFDIFDHAGMRERTEMVLGSLKQIPQDILRPSLLDPESTPRNCHWNADKLLSQLGAAS